MIEPEYDFINHLGLGLFNKLKVQYPRVFDREIPLSATGISSWTFFDWKKKGLIPFESENEKDRVKLNLIEYVWLKAIQSLREFGVPYQELSKMKTYLYDSKIYLEVLKEWPLILESAKASGMHSSQDIENFKKTFEFLNENLNENSAIDNSIMTVFATSVFRMILMDDEAFLVAFKRNDGEGLMFFMYSFEVLKAIEDETNPLYQDHVQIKVLPIIRNLLSEINLEKYAFTLGLLNHDEQRVINAIREGNYSEIIIRKSGEQDMIIDVAKEFNLKDEKAKELRVLLGLNKYDEVQVKFRNEKDLFIKNKKRLK